MKYQFNGLDADQLGGSLFENEMMSEANGGRRRNRPRRGRGGRGQVMGGMNPKRMQKRQSRLASKCASIGYVPSSPIEQPIIKSSENAEMPINPQPMSGFDGASALKKINWQMVGLGVALGAFAIVVVNKLKLIK
jgi:hypothetical protein